MLRGRVGVALVAAVLAACGSSAGSLSSADARRISKGVADLDELDPGVWQPPERRQFVDQIIVRRCGSPDLANQSAIAVDASSVRAYWPPQYPKGGPDPGEAQVTVAIYASADAAAAAAGTPDRVTFTDCIMDSIRERYRAEGVDPRAATQETGVPLTRSSIETRTGSDQGAPISFIQGRFPEEILGGYDNFHDVAEARGRAGQFVVTSYFVTNSQQGDPTAARALVLKLTREALGRVNARLPS